MKRRSKVPPGRCSLTEAARRMGLDKGTLAEWREAGLVPEPAKHGTNLCTYSEETVEELMAQVPQIRERQEMARRDKQAKTLKERLRPAGGRYSLSDIASSANLATTTLWHYRKRGLIPEPDQIGPGNTRSYSEQVKDEILAHIPKIKADLQANVGMTSERAREQWQDPGYIANVKAGNARPEVREKRSRSARAGMSAEQRKKAGERSKARWQKIKTALHPKKRNRGRPAGSKLPIHEREFFIVGQAVELEVERLMRSNLGMSRTAAVEIAREMVSRGDGRLYDTVKQYHLDFLAVQQSKN